MAADGNTLLVTVDETGLMKPCDRGGDKLMNTLRLALANLKMINKIELRWRRLGDGLAKDISNFIRQSTTLTSIDLSDNYISDVGCREIALSVAPHTRVTSLDLSGNKIGDLGVATLSTMLITNSTLTDLNLSGNVLEKMGMQALGGGLRVNRGLTSLSLVENFFGDHGALELGWALSYNSRLTSLTLRSNDIGNAGAVVLAAGLGKNSTLQHLNLADNSIGNRGSTQLSEALFVNTTLETLDLSLNDIGSEGKDALLDAIDFSYRCEPVSDDHVLALAMCTHPRLGEASALWMIFVMEDNNFKKHLLTENKKMTANEKAFLVRSERETPQAEPCNFDAFLAEGGVLPPESPIRRVVHHAILRKPRNVLFDGRQLRVKQESNAKAKGLRPDKIQPLTPGSVKKPSGTAAPLPQGASSKALPGSTAR